MNPQDRLEAELRAALRRTDAPSGFADRVLALAREQQATPSGLRDRLARLLHAPALRLAASAALVLAIAGGAMEYTRYERERRAGEAARQQLMLALRITGSKLKHAQHKVNGVNAQQHGPVIEDSEKLQ